jgi:hypothetical protein
MSATGVGSSNYYDLTENAGGPFGFYGQNGSTSAAIGTTITVTPVAGAWNHLALVVNPSSMAIYVNGTQSGSSFTYSNAFTSSTIYLGRSGQYNGHSYCGSYDDLRFFNTALSAAQVQAVYATQGVPSRGSQVLTIQTSQRLLFILFHPRYSRTPKQLRTSDRHRRN